jgi:hypothetical protein
MKYLLDKETIYRLAKIAYYDGRISGLTGEAPTDNELEKSGTQKWIDWTIDCYKVEDDHEVEA